jgi:drug/metabolite transporter (DMT)-like permease
MHGRAAYLHNLRMTDRKAHLDTLAIVSVVICSFLWGLNQVAAKAALSEVSPLMQAAVRSLGGVVLVLLWARLRGIALFERDGTLPGGLLAGALFAAEFACIFTGLQYTTASRMIVFIYFAPFIVALGMPFIARAERLSALQTGGLVLAFAGVASAFAEGFTQPAIGPKQWIGDARHRLKRRWRINSACRAYCSGWGRFGTATAGRSKCR